MVNRGRCRCCCSDNEAELVLVRPVAVGLLVVVPGTGTKRAPGGMDISGATVSSLEPGAVESMAIDRLFETDGTADLSSVFLDCVDGLLFLGPVVACGVKETRYAFGWQTRDMTTSDRSNISNIALTTRRAP